MDVFQGNIICSIEEHNVDASDANVKRHKSKRTELVLKEQSFHTNVATGKAQKDQNGAECSDPPRHKQRRLCVAELP